MGNDLSFKSLDFVIIGAQKAGTTALSHFLAQHPSLALAKGKEVHLFSQIPESLRWSAGEIDHFYRPYFEEDSANQIWGEATPIYLYWAPIIPALKRYNSQLKIIVLLRDPVERAISHYQMEASRGNEHLPFWLALLFEPFRLWWAGNTLSHAQRCHSYMSRGFYAQQLSRLREHFPDEQILVIENNDLKARHQETLDKVFKFLGVDSMEIEPQRIFEGEYRKSDSGILLNVVKMILRRRFRKSNRELKKILIAMKLKVNWSWLN